MRTRTAVGAALLLSAGGFFGSWAAASASSLQVDGGVLQTWSFPVDDFAVQPARAQIAQDRLATEPAPTVDETVTTAEAAPPAEEAAPTAEPAGDLASTTAPPPAPASEPQP